MRFNKEELLKILVKKGEINQKDINFKFDNELDFFKKLILFVCANLISPIPANLISPPCKINILKIC